MEKVTDDIKIELNKAILAIKSNDKQSFERAVLYILKNLQPRDYSVFSEYLFNKLRS